jgi:hypothetical protein
VLEQIMDESLKQTSLEYVMDLTQEQLASIREEFKGRSITVAQTTLWDDGNSRRDGGTALSDPVLGPVGHPKRLYRELPGTEPRGDRSSGWSVRAVATGQMSADMCCELKNSFSSFQSFAILASLTSLETVIGPPVVPGASTAIRELKPFHAVEGSGVSCIAPGP